MNKRGGNFFLKSFIKNKKELFLVLVLGVLVISSMTFVSAGPCRDTGNFEECCLDGTYKDQECCEEYPTSLGCLGKPIRAEEDIIPKMPGGEEPIESVWKKLGEGFRKGVALPFNMIKRGAGNLKEMVGGLEEVGIEAPRNVEGECTWVEDKGIECPAVPEAGKLYLRGCNSAVTSCKESYIPLVFPKGDRCSGTKIAFDQVTINYAAEGQVELSICNLEGPCEKDLTYSCSNGAGSLAGGSIDIKFKTPLTDEYTNPKRSNWVFAPKEEDPSTNNLLVMGLRNAGYTATGKTSQETIDQAGTGVKQKGGKDAGRVDGGQGSGLIGQGPSEQEKEKCGKEWQCTEWDPHICNGDTQMRECLCECENDDCSGDGRTRKTCETSISGYPTLPSRTFTSRIRSNYPDIPKPNYANSIYTAYGNEAPEYLLNFNSQGDFIEITDSEGHPIDLTIGIHAGDPDAKVALTTIKDQYEVQAAPKEATNEYDVGIEGMENVAEVTTQEAVDGTTEANFNVKDDAQKGKGQAKLVAKNKQTGEVVGETPIFYEVEPSRDQLLSEASAPRKSPIGTVITTLIILSLLTGVITWGVKFVRKRKISNLQHPAPVTSYPTVAEQGMTFPQQQPQQTDQTEDRQPQA